MNKKKPRKTRLGDVWEFENTLDLSGKHLVFVTDKWLFDNEFAWGTGASVLSENGEEWVLSRKECDRFVGNLFEDVELMLRTPPQFFDNKHARKKLKKKAK